MHRCMNPTMTLPEGLSEELQFKKEQATPRVEGGTLQEGKACAKLQGEKCVGMSTVGQGD